MTSYIHIYVDATMWETLVANTGNWPPEKRNQRGIVRYAMSELYHDLQAYPEDVSPSPFPVGTQSVQGRVTDPEEIAEWAFLTEKYGSSGAALRFALATLARSLSGSAPSLD